MNNGKKLLPGEITPSTIPTPFKLKKLPRLGKKFKLFLAGGSVLSVLLIGISLINALTFTFIQTNWSGGADPTSYPVASVDNTGWNKYSSQTNVDDSAGDHLILASDTSTITQTERADFDLGDFGSETPPHTRAMGDGTGGEVQLANQNPQDIDTWSEPSMQPFELNSSSSMVQVGDEIYVTAGDSSDLFYKYSITDNQWTQLASTPETLKIGATMTYYGPDNTLYLLRGSGTTFWKYDIASDLWSSAPSPIYGTRDGGVIDYPGVGTEIYVIVGGSLDYFEKFDVSSGVWTDLASSSPPGLFGTGADIVYPGAGNLLYITQGRTSSTNFWIYNMTTNNWNDASDGGQPTDVPEAPYSGVSLVRTDDTDKLYYLPGDSNQSGSQGFYEYTISTDSWTPKGNTPDLVHGGAGAVFHDSQVYTLSKAGSAGNEYTTRFWLYKESTDKWSTIAFLPPNINTDLGGALVGAFDAGANEHYVYALRGNNTPDFYRFSVTANSGFGGWTKMADAPGNVYYGSDLAYDSSVDSAGIYATQGNTGSTSGFWRYDIASNTWTTYTSPGSVGHGSALAFDSSTGYLYLTMGDGSTSFKRCQISTGPLSVCSSWDNTISPVNYPIDRGGDLAHVGAGIFYALQGNYTNRVLRYDVSADSWNTAATTPENTPVGEGAALMYPGLDDYLYIYPGGNTRTFWKFNYAGVGEWTNLSDAPGTPKSGSDITFPGNAGLFLYATQGGKANTFWRYAFRANYYSSGTFTSSVLDTTENIGFGQISWDEINTASTGITMKVRTSNDSNMSGAPDWSSCSNVSQSSDISSNSCVTDGDRYIQYQATLTTSSSLQTPRLQAVHIVYDHYSFNGDLTGSAFNTEDPTNVVSAIIWDEDATLPSGTNIKFQIRTAPDNGGAPGAWGQFLGPTSSSDYYEASAPGCSKSGNTVTCTGIHSSQLDATDDQWFQYKMFMTSVGGNTPQLDEVHVQYVINTAPNVTITNVPEQSVDGVVEMVYSTSDAEEGTLTNYFFVDVGASLTAEIPDSVSTSDITLSGTGAEQFPAGGGTIMIDKEMITYSSRTGSVLTGISRGANQTRPTSHSASTAVWMMPLGGIDGGDDLGVLSTGSGYDVTWNVKDDLTNFYRSDAKVRIAAVDGNAANQVGYDDKTLVLDTKSPDTLVLGVDSRLDKLAISASDNSAMQMKVSNNADLSFDGTNSDSGQWVAFAATKDWVMEADSNGIETVYIQFRDIYGNLSAEINSSTPQVPEDLVTTDISYVYGDDYKVFVSWQKIVDPAPGFAAYDLYMSTEGPDPYSDTYTLEATITDIAENFYVDTGLDVNTEYFYRVVARDLDGNVSNYNQNIGVQQGSSIEWDSGVTPGSGSGGSSPTAPVISNVSVDGVDLNSAVISWDTDKLANALVAYSTTSGVYTQQSGVTTMEYSHTVTLTDLDPANTYYFEVISYDATDNKAESIDDNTQKFTTGADTIAPTISNVDAIAGVSSAGIVWSTDESANSKVEYGLTDSYGNETTTTSDYVVGHSVTLTGLDPETHYFYRVISSDASGNTTVSDGYEFTTVAGEAGTDKDITAPEISDVALSNVTSTSIDVSFTTSEPARGLMEYGTTTDYARGDTSGNLDTFLTQHTITLHNLSPATTYHFKIYALDSAGNMGQTADDTFITQPEDVKEEMLPDGGSGGESPPVISSGAPVVQNVTAVSADIIWSTSDPSTSTVLYRVSGSGATPLIAGGGATFTNDHLVKLAGLAANTTYEFQVKSQDSDNDYIISPLSTFRTVSMPGLSNVRVANLTFNSASIAWQTSVPTDSQIEYGSQTGSYDNVLTDSLVGLTHQIEVNNLAIGGTYYFIVKGQSADGTLLSSDEYSFTTRATPSIMKLDITNITPTTAQLNFETNILSTIGVQYENTRTGELGTKLGQGFGNQHTIALTGLSPNTTYSVVIKMTDQNNNSYDSDKYSFETADDHAGPVISLIETHANLNNDQSTVQAIISWNTNEDSTAQVKYTQSVGGKDYEYNSEIDRDYGKDHIVIINDLKTSTAYQFIVISVDPSGNETISEPNVMLTPGKKVSIFELIFGSLEETFSWLKDI